MHCNRQKMLIMKHLKSVLAVFAAAATLLSCESVSDLDTVKEMNSELSKATGLDGELAPETDTEQAPEAEQTPDAEPTPDAEQTPEVEPVPEVKDVEAEFNNMFPDATDVEWEDEGEYWEVSFEMETPEGEVEGEVWFDKDGNWLGTETEISTDALPQYVLDAIAASEYANAELDDEADYIQTPSGSWYELELECDDFEVEVMVTEDGTLTVTEIDD